MRQSAAKAIFSYWQSLVPESGVPARSAIEPRFLKPHLPDIFILERLDRAVFAFRLAGTRLCARYGRELRDHDFIRLWPAADHGVVLEAMNRCLQAPEPVALRGVAATMDGKTVAFDLLLLPIADSDGQVTRIMGALLPEDDRALREGAIYVSQTIEQSGGREAEATVASAAFAAARETHVAFLRVIDGATMPLSSAPTHRSTVPLSDAV